MKWIKKLFESKVNRQNSRFVCKTHGKNGVINLSGYGEELDGRYCQKCVFSKYLKDFERLEEDSKFGTFQKR